MKKIYLLAQLLVFVMYAHSQTLYSTTGAGGTYDCGTLFSYDVATGTASTLHNFQLENGKDPAGSLLQASDGNLYGVTTSGGSDNSGVLFRFDPTSAVYSKLADFGSATGLVPACTLIEGSDGNLYGTASGGLHNGGTIFKYNIADSTLSAVYNFQTVTGGRPCSGLVEQDGKLYGTTSEGGILNKGTIFCFDIYSLTYQKLYDFTGFDGQGGGDLILGRDGKLVGVSMGGLYGRGVLFSFDIATSSYSKVLDIVLTSSPGPKIIQASDGKIYGLGRAVNGSNQHQIFSYDFTTGLFEIEAGFSFWLQLPLSGLFEASDGKLYGNDLFGGITFTGTGFSFDPITKSFVTILDYQRDIPGYFPAASFIEYCSLKIYYKDVDGDGFGDPANHISSCSATPPRGYVINNTDCDDTKLLYADNDGDGYGAGSSIACGVANNNDCDDNNPDVHPGAVEICDNGIDDNCDGRIDEGCTITDDVKVSIANNIAYEGNRGLHYMKFKVRLNKRSTKSVWITFRTEDGTATAGSDYQSQVGTVVIRPGEKSTRIKVSIIGDTVPEPDETFIVQLTGAVNAAVDNGTATGTIVNDDGVTFSQSTEHLKSNAVSIQTVEVMPNPASDMAKIKLTGFSGNVQLQLRSFDGRLLHHEKIFTSGKTTEYQINVSNYASGTYLLTAIGEDGKKQSLKLIITR